MLMTGSGSWFKTNHRWKRVLRKQDLILLLFTLRKDFTGIARSSGSELCTTRQDREVPPVSILFYHKNNCANCHVSIDVDFV